MKGLAETHGIKFELVRHFLGRMLDGEWSSTRGQWSNVVVSAFATLLPAGVILLREGNLSATESFKYRDLALLANPAPFRAAATADVLALLTLVLAVTGLLALIQWQSFFPGRRDYIALAGLPIRSRQIFAARFGTVLIFCATLVLVMNFVPSLIAPLEFGGRWQRNPSYWANVGALGGASGSGCLFLLFGMVGLQGVLWNILPARWFTRVTVYVQGLLVGVLIFAGLYSFSIRDWTAPAIAQLPRLAWAPPVWFIGLHERLLGDSDPFFHAMANRALLSVALAAGVMVLTYIVSYRRYRQLLVEAPVHIAIPRKFQWSFLRLIAPQPQQEAIMQFMVKTLTRSRANRMVWFAYLGGAIGIMLNSSIIDGAFLARHGGVDKALRFAVLFWPLGISVVLLNGIRHVMSIPCELPANWIFRLTEAQGRKQWMSAVERFVLCYTIVPIQALMLPVAGHTVGWMTAFRMTCLQTVVSLILFELMFYSWQQLPFTCSYIPGKRPIVGVLAGYMGMLCLLVPMLTVIIATASRMKEPFLFFFVAFAGVWVWAHKRRRDGWGETCLIYEDIPYALPDLGITELAWSGPARFVAPRRAAPLDTASAPPLLPSFGHAVEPSRGSLRTWREALGQDLRYAFRLLRRRPAFTVVAALTLALGIGATTSIYTMIDCVLWRPIPIPRLSNLAMVLQAPPGQSNYWTPATPGDIDEIRRTAITLDSLAGFQSAMLNLVDSGGEALRTEVTRVTPNFLDVAGVEPAIGRGFSPNEDQPGRERVVILGDSLWRLHFRADPAIVGSTIRLDGRNFTVIGIMPPTFYFPRASRQIWIPLALTPEERTSRTAALLECAGRLSPGHTLPELAAELKTISARMEQAHPDTNAHRRFMAWTYQRYFSGDLVPIYTAMLLGAAFFVLLIACVNVANLQLARATARWREIAVRTALGASRRRLISQLLTESTALAAIGATLGLLLAKWGLSVIQAGIPAELVRYNPGLAAIGLNRHALTFTIFAALLSGMLAGLVPAWRGSRADLIAALRPARHRMRSMLVGVEIAMAVVLLVGAGLMVRGFQSLVGNTTSLHPTHLLTLQLSLTESKYAKDPQLSAYYHQILDRLAALPGVQSAVAVSALPYSRHGDTTPFAIEGRPADPGHPTTAQVQRATANYFPSMAIPLRAGRFPSATDTPTTQKVAAITESMAKRWWTAGASPLGARLQIAGQWVTIVGIVGDIEHSTIDHSLTPTVYLPFDQSPAREMDIALRTTGDAAALSPAVRAAVRALDPEQPINNLATMSNLIRQEAFVFAYMAALMGTFGVLALVLATVGVYGVMAYVISGQTHEIGVRMALGAPRNSILGMLFRRGMRATLLGMLAGLLPAYGLAQLMRAAVFGVSAVSPAIFGGIPLVLALAAAVAIYIPARRALKVDPMSALRMD